MKNITRLPAVRLVFLALSLTTCLLTASVLAADQVSQGPPPEISRDAFSVPENPAGGNNKAIIPDNYTVVVDSQTICRSLLGDQGLIDLSLEFATASSRLTAVARQQVEEIARALEQKSLFGRKISIQGHTDDRGAAEANQQLSQKRATAVKDELISLGIAAERLQSEGRGESCPIADNRTADGRARNRRVTLTLLPK